MATNDKYDRQLRLWGPNGQRKLMESHILLIGADAVGTETLKNLVLPGIGKFTVLDDRVVQQSDLGVNFFVEQSALGKPRAEVVTELLCELNPDVFGSAKVANVHNLLDKEPQFFLGFSLIIAANFPHTQGLCALSSLCEAHGIPLIAVRSCGLLGTVRVQLSLSPALASQRAAAHYVIDTKSDSDLLHDLRLLDPFPAMREYCESFSLEALNSEEFSHVPYIALLYQARHQLETELGRLLTSKDTALIKQRLNVMSRSGCCNEDNFREALRETHRLFAQPRITDELAQAIHVLGARTLTAQDSVHCFLVQSLGEYLEKHKFPPLESLPDMHSSSAYYARIQEIFRAQAHEEFEDFKRILHGKLTAAGLSLSHFPQDEIEIFAKRAACASTVTTSSLCAELRGECDATGECVRETLMFDRYEDPQQTPIVWYLALRAADIFFLERGRWPGDTDNASALTHDADEVFAHMKALAQRLGLEDAYIENRTETTSRMDTESPAGDGESAVCVVTRAHAEEVTRYGGMETHAISALIGGIASQESAKLLTNQYVPLQNTYVFNGIASVGATYRL